MSARTDGELLALAAKAAGIDGAKPWNPLTNSGDAMDLAVHLRMLVDIRHIAGSTDVMAGRRGRLSRFTVTHGDDASAATRRAIVKCAADIGEFAMKATTLPAELAALALILCIAWGWL